MFSTYDEWRLAATERDDTDDVRRWKADPVSQDYDHVLIQQRLDQLKQARQTDQLHELVYLLRSSLSRNLGNIGKQENYTHCLVGTKQLIEDYLEEVELCLGHLFSHSWDAMDKYRFFLNTQRVYGHTALLFSGGASFGLIHGGVVKCLFEQKLLPRIVSGSSSGSIIASLLCTRTDDELPLLFQPGSVDFNFFSNSDGVMTMLTRLVRKGMLYDDGVLMSCLQSNFGDMTFQEAYNRTRRILNITVSSSSVHQSSLLLNYLTTPNVLIRSAITGSCAVPLLFSSAALLSKTKRGHIVPYHVEGEVWIDGSVENDLPTQRLAELFNVNHFIVCQVNPHVYPFMRKASQSQNGSWASRAFARLVQLSTMEVKHRLDQLSELSVLTDWIRMAQSISSQQYTGDITILPTIRWSDFIRLVQNPSSEQVMEATLRGEMATWPLVSIIRDHVRIELALDRLIYQLRLEQWTTQTKDTTSGASMIRRSSLHDMRPPGFFLVGSDSESLSE